MRITKTRPKAKAVSNHREYINTALLAPQKQSQTDKQKERSCVCVCVCFGPVEEPVPY